MPEHLAHRLVLARVLLQEQEGAEVAEEVQVDRQAGHRLDDPRELLRNIARQLVPARLVREQPGRRPVGDERPELLEIDADEFRDRGRQDILQTEIVLGPPRLDEDLAHPSWGIGKPGAFRQS